MLDHRPLAPLPSTDRGPAADAWSSAQLSPGATGPTDSASAGPITRLSLARPETRS
ncbi:MAG: hypothetical protein LBK54_01390 [Propionibacteriaceae bacterium]|jgi:hypothetical protein|nr:hypothetical protein [Propionibacteriaceae bacterium]